MTKKTLLISVAFLLFHPYLSKAQQFKKLHNIDHRLRIGINPSQPCTVISKLAAKILARDYGIEASLVQSTDTLIFFSLARGGIDMSLNAWLPKTHEEALKRYIHKIDQVGKVYSGGKLGLIVPHYATNQFQSIGDLADETKGYEIKNRIYTVEPGSGISALSAKAIRSYGLSKVRLINSNSMSIISLLNTASINTKPIVIGFWRPHWIFKKWKLTFLEDPNNVFSSNESLIILARKGLINKHPRLAEFFKNFHMSLEAFETLLSLAHDHGAEKAVNTFSAEYFKKKNAPSKPE